MITDDTTSIFMCRRCKAATPHERQRTERTLRWQCKPCAAKDATQAEIQFADETATHLEALDGMNDPGQFKRASSRTKGNIPTEKKE